MSFKSSFYNAHAIELEIFRPYKEYFMEEFVQIRDLNIMTEWNSCSAYNSHLI